MAPLGYLAYIQTPGLVENVQIKEKHQITSNFLPSFLLPPADIQLVLRGKKHMP